ncbi:MULTISPECIES: hypothetical protein [Commensalibacter]|uniref:Uncharacterized protein n=2 Tax=Commensalibacter TaxID=1079922 RepID=W7E8H0_9PROT|nr:MULTISPECIES: hypothetical protein [Commensalibacter]EUK19431.1 hypothetical protein COMX_06755 [Commensalibacter papalotli (ex Servin-Garciduenas et al. 2014)]CAI3935377.1 unnamed protein product [Commensalibacter papalotli (ex Botero et al. 2024)]CAI3951535.1 unnamed protein product [Commensalibacter papalotli (ex Botero et al. 2024)]
MTDKKDFLSAENTSSVSSVDNGDYKLQQKVEASLQPKSDFLSDDSEYHSDKKNASLRLMIPTYLDNQLTQIAASKRVTKRFLILKALAQAGYHLEKEDLVTDKRRVR